MEKKCLTKKIAAGFWALLIFAVGLSLRDFGRSNIKLSMTEMAELRDAMSDAPAHGSVAHGGQAFNNLVASLGGSSCGTCHIGSGQKKEVKGLWMSGHENSLNTAAAAALREMGGGVTEMETMHACLSCHDGTVAAGRGAYGGHAREKIQEMAAADLGASHPVGMDYLDAMRRKPGAFKDPSQERSIRLSNNKVTCSSCHATHSDFKDVKSAASRRNALCTTCHNL